MQNLEVVQADYDIERGVFRVTLAGGQSLQCHLEKDYVSDWAHQQAVRIGELGIESITCAAINDWAVTEFGLDAVEHFMIEQADNADLIILF